MLVGRSNFARITHFAICVSSDTVAYQVHKIAVAAARKEANVASTVRRVRTIINIIRHFWGMGMASKGPKKTDSGFDLSQAPSHLLRRCVQYANDLFSHEPGASDLTKQQFTVLAAVERNEGMSQTDLVTITGIDRSTLAEMIRRMIEKGLLDRERTENDQRANSVRIAMAGKKALRGARSASDRVERTLLSGLNAADRARFLKMLSSVVSQAESEDGAANEPRV